MNRNDMKTSARINGKVTNIQQGADDVVELSLADGTKILSMTTYLSNCFSD